jgi:hypothetical protein
MGINLHGILFAWGKNKEGLLGLGYNITEIDYPTEILANIKELSISENHAVSIDFDGEVYSWGSGKYGELCQDKRIYCSYPTKITHLNSSSDEDLSININIINIKNFNSRKFNKVYCTENLTCFIDENKNFSYFGIIKKIRKGVSKSGHGPEPGQGEIKNLIKNVNGINDASDSNTIFQEKFIMELEKEKFIQIAVGNGLLGLLSEKGTVFTIDENDNINSLYSKYSVYSIGISNNQLFGFCKIVNNYNNITNLDNTTVVSSPTKLFLDKQNCNFNYNNNQNINNISHLNLLNKTEDEESFSNLDNTQNPNFNININLNNLNQNINFFLCHWSSDLEKNSNKQNKQNKIINKINDSWTTNLYKILTDDIDLDNIQLLNSVNKDIIFLMLNINTAQQIQQQQNLYQNQQANNNIMNFNLEKENNKQNFNNSMVIMNISSLRNKINENIKFILIASFDDSFNMKYKRVKGNYQGIRTIDFNKSKDFLKDETLDITEKLNRSITKRQKLHRLSIMNEIKNKPLIDKSIIVKEKEKEKELDNIYNINNYTNNKEKNNILRQNQDHSNINFSNYNISMNDSSVNYLRSPEKLTKRKNEENINMNQTLNPNVNLTSNNLRVYKSSKSVIEDYKNINNINNYYNHSKEGNFYYINY